MQWRCVMIKEVINLVKQNNNDISITEKQIIFTYLKNKHICFEKNNVIVKYLNDITQLNDFRNFEKICKKFQLDNMNELLQIMEQLVSDTDKKTNGVVYTPFEVKKYMISEMQIAYNGENITICDPACGCGSFLVTIAEYLHNKFNITFKKIFTNLIYGIDILEHNIEKAKVILTVLALENGENFNGKFNLLVSNSLNLDWKKTFSNIFRKGGFDYIVGNPPYVSLKNMSSEVKDSLNQWKTASYGNTDLYIIFYELAMNIVKCSGTIGYIPLIRFLQV